MGVSVHQAAGLVWQRTIRATVWCLQRFAFPMLVGTPRAVNSSAMRSSIQPAARRGLINYRDGSVVEASINNAAASCGGLSRPYMAWAVSSVKSALFVIVG